MNKKLNKFRQNLSYDIKSEKTNNLEQFHEAQKFILKKEIQCLSVQKNQRVASHIKFHDGETIYQFDRSNIMTPQHNHFSKFFADKQFEFERKIKSREVPFRESIYNDNIGSPTSDFSYQNIQIDAQNILSQQSQSIKYSNMHQSFLNKVEAEKAEQKSKISSLIQGYRNRIQQKDKFESFHRKYQKNLQEQILTPQSPTIKNLIEQEQKYLSENDLNSNQISMKQEFFNLKQQIKDQEQIDEDENSQK